MDIDKIFEKVPYDKVYPIPNWQRYAAVFGLTLGVLAAFYFVVIKGKDETIANMTQELSKVQKEVDDNKGHAAKLSKLKEKVHKLEAERQEASKQLPSDKEIPELLEQVSNIGTQTGLEFQTFKPLPENMRDFYSEVPVNIEVKGKFHDILMFFDEIAHLPRIVTIGDIKIQSVQATGGQQPKGAKEASPSAVQMTCLATTYRFLESSVGKDKKPGEPGQTAPGGGAAPPAPPGGMSPPPAPKN